MQKIVNMLKAAGLYFALIFALYGNQAYSVGSEFSGGEGGRHRDISLAPSRAGGFDLASKLSLSRSQPSGFKGELTFPGAPKTEAVGKTGGLGY